MKITIENTSEIVTMANGTQARVWDGVTESGVRCHLLVMRVAVHKNDDASAFERELQERPPQAPAVPRVFDPRFIL